MQRFVFSAARFVLPLALVACGPTLAPREADTAPDTQLPPDFVQAEAETGVPAELLMAIAWSETRLQMVSGHEEFPGQAAGFGVMALRGDFVEYAAELAGRDAEDVRTVREDNVVAAAHLLAEGAAELGVAVDDIDAMAPVVARYSDIVDEEAAAEYVHYQVYRSLEEGVSIEGFTLEPMIVAPDYPLPLRDGYRTGDGSAVWTPSPNYSSRGGANVDFLVIHSCEGSYSGCWGWLTNPAAGASAHYVVSENGNEVRQLVDEDNKAWHIAANYDCANNFSQECWRNGTSMNSISVGIEHAGYASQSSWDNNLIAVSGDLACGITSRHNIPRDSYHIVGHGQLQPWNRTDPGAAWPWADYLADIQNDCAGGGPNPTPRKYVIDSNNGANVAGRSRSTVSANWWGSSSVSGYWNTGYWVAPTEAVSDGAEFEFNISSNTCVKVEAWWPAASDRSNSITWIGYKANGNEVGRKTVNQRINGSKWNTLGHWRFTSGWNKVVLSRWTTPGYYAVADAVRLSKSTNCN